MKFLCSLTVLLLSIITVHAQIINAYAKVGGIQNKTLVLSDVNENADTFEDNEQVIIMQMQGNVLSSLPNNSSSGNPQDLGTTGMYEIITIAYHTEISGIARTITFTEELKNNYLLNPNSSIQIISFPELGDPHYSSTSNMKALDWNGNIGGVLAFQVEGSLNLQHNLSADATGFTGGEKVNWVEGYIYYLFGFIPIWIENAPLSNNPNTYYTNHSNGHFAEKGEGIFKVTNANVNYGRGKIVNGAGGGNPNNAGGGGGANYTSGGEGGQGYNIQNTSSSGGLGGSGLSAEISAERLFMGGGGGGGQGNNSTATNGGNGGGIILIKAGKIQTAGNPSEIKITANGANALNSNNDGAGGGGAGGSILIHTYYWDVAANSPISIEANGADGGSVNSSEIHGGGGGGGQGAIIYSFSQPAANVLSNTDKGEGGCNNNSIPCLSSATNGDGVTGEGIMEFSIGPLPIELLLFNAEKAGPSKTYLYWETVSEINNDYFEVERSANMITWEPVLIMPGAGFSNKKLEYYAEDSKPLFGQNYYRLKQVDYNGEFKYSEIRTVSFEGGGFSETDVLVYPNPARDVINVEYKDLHKCELIFLNAAYELLEVHYAIDDDVFQLYTENLSNGVYFIMVVQSDVSITKRVVVTK